MTLIPVDLSPLADVQAIRGNTAAQFVSLDECPPAVSGVASARYLAHSTGRSDRARRSVPGLGALSTPEASETHVGTGLVDVPGANSVVVSNAEVTIGDIELLGGEAIVRVDEAGPAHRSRPTGRPVPPRSPTTW